jgi:predicted TPR repeat methyltransferase
MSDDLLNAAYALRTPDDNRRLYAAWAATYDQTFAQATGYRLPAQVAAAYAAQGGASPVIDIGAGTGLVGAALSALGIGPVDGTDLSPEMLGVAARRGVYRDLIAADLTADAALPGAPWAGAVSAGTFTLGHLGPAALAAVLDLVRPGGLIALSVNLAHYRAEGFDTAMAALAPRITGLWQEPTRIYDQTGAAHANDLAMIVTFRTAAP